MTRPTTSTPSYRADAPHFIPPAAPATLPVGQSFRVLASDGSPLVEVYVDEQGPVVRLGSPDVRLDFPGHLQIRAASLTLDAQQGELNLRSQEDTVVRGKTIRLN